MFKAWFNRRGYKNIFCFIIGKHSPSLLGYKAMMKARKELNREAENVGLKRIKAKEPHIKWFNN